MRLGQQPPSQYLNKKVSGVKKEFHYNVPQSCRCSHYDPNRVISEPPVFSKRIESATAVLGNTVKLQGTLKGSVPITVKWMKDSELLRDDDPNVQMSFVNNITSISFSSVELKHGGKYTCLAENEAGQQKCEATLTIQG